MEGIEKEDMLGNMVGKGAAKFYESAGYSVRTWKMGTKGVVSYSGNEYLVVRHGSRK